MDNVNIEDARALKDASNAMKKRLKKFRRQRAVARIRALAIIVLFIGLPTGYVVKKTKDTIQETKKM